MPRMNFLYSTLIPLSLGVVSALASAQTTYTIAVIGKTKNDTFYQQSLQGCENYAQSVKASGVTITCRYGGAEFSQHIREQAKSTNALIDDGVDGILISITDSKFLAKHALKRAHTLNIPVFTFDSDLLPEHQHYRLAYIGTNNFDFGVALGEAAKQFKRYELEQVCIQSGHKSTPNLDERIKGVRYSLSGGKSTERLKGENGWQEYSRCPFYTSGKRGKSVNQLEYLLEQEVPTFIAVAGFAQFSPEYIERVSPFKQQIESERSVIVSADSEKLQLEILAQGLSTVNIGQRPFDMGRIGTQVLHQYLKTGQLPEEEFIYLGFHTCYQDNAETCTNPD
ncbi:substrate-binding domain-containing protein [Vibrio sp. SCSIO 43136]|uniref:substrate-binding domain-containing protein n=1 Tax=Vibrio sp. SCSIO 43136 TaxID=2819101 RepID=UPI002075FA71|nr:substrate-binding domain-containing protein [Vibrio sp. SCSIO 43136]USD67259.1 substrate-binding domain-containing protein [Vibrio sp. SCSIO 43136]